MNQQHGGDLQPERRESETRAALEVHPGTGVLAGTGLSYP